MPSMRSRLIRHGLVACTIPALGAVSLAEPSESLLSAPLERAISRTASRSADPANARMNLLARLTFSPACFPESMTEEEYQAIVDEWGLLPPTQFGEADARYWTDTIVWTGDLSTGTSAQAARANLTYSFPADGTTWGLSEVSSTGPNDLNSRLTTLFGASNLDRGREYFRQALASWRRYAGLTYSEVADDNTAMAQGTARVATRGDIRMGGLGFGTSSFLAYNAFPSASGVAGVGGGDMCFNTSFFTAGAFNSSTNNYRYMRNTAGHEHGHGLGNIHSVPCNSTKLMEPSIFTGQDMLQIDDRRGGNRNYGDRFAGNNSAANARQFGDLTTPILKSIIERNLSTNGTAGPNNTDEDWYRFELSSTQTVVISAAPTGGTYTAGQQSFSCSGSTGSINASSAGNLNIELRAADGTTILQTASAAGAGATETLNAGSRAAGTYYVRVFDVGPNASANQTVQLYDLTVRIGAAAAPPQAIAGLHKRIAANASCFFMGDINSAAMEGSLSNPTSFDWDLDGDGTFETNDNPQPNRQYSSNGVYPVTLRVTDSNGMASTDTIDVTVFGATTSVLTCSPNNGNSSTSVPVTITGNNLKNVTSASMVTVSGSGVAVSGTPVPNTLGTSVAGLSFDISGGAAAGARNITVNNADGMATGVGLFTVNNAPPPMPGPFSLSAPANGSTLAGTTPVLIWTASSDAASYTVDVDDSASFVSPEFSNTLAGTSHAIPAGPLNYKVLYFWRAIATNPQGGTASTPASFSFRTGPCLGDANYDKLVDFGDVTQILGSWAASYPVGESGPGDSSDDDVVDFNDVTVTLAQYGVSCP